ncbi:MAG: CHRD domain-containing protein [Planctomycetota bacterium]|nr:MAG: CHRD domain-containing protein [Planctomycetota bacterium]
MFPRPVLFLWLVLAAPLAAQDRFRATLDGDQEVPPVATAAGGWAEFTLNTDGSLGYRVETWGLSGTAAHIHTGTAGSSGSVLFPLAGGPESWIGVTPPLAAADVAALRSAGLYVNVHTVAHPGGEIRGQIDASPRVFAAHCNGAQVVLHNPTTETAEGRLTVDDDRSITYHVESATYTGYAAHIHLGGPGVNGAIVFALQGGPLVWSGTTAPMTPEQFTIMQAGGYYVNIHHSITPGDEIRGQILNQGERYGFGCGAAPRLSVDGATMPGAPLSLRLDGGVAGSTGVLVVSTAPASGALHACALLAAPPFVRQFPVQLDAAGAARIALQGPDLPASADFYLQFGARPGQSSNAVKLRVEVF